MKLTNDITRLLQVAAAFEKQPTPQIVKLATGDFYSLSPTGINTIADQLYYQTDIPESALFRTPLIGNPSQLKNHVTISCSAYIQVILGCNIDKLLIRMGDSM